MQEYILVWQDRPLVERYARTAEGTWVYSVVEGLEATLDLASVECELKLSEVYRDVEFPRVPVLRAEFAEEDLP